jgi:NADPH:quinone reductase-like Zn-dependent oxidoreductase
MRHAVIPRYGPPEVFEIRNAPDPVAQSGEVRIAVAAAGVNFADVLARLGIYPDAPKRPFTPGYEISGTVDAVAADVTTIRPGDRVLALTRFGGYATSVVVPQEQVFASPPTIGDVEAAALPVNYLTALVALHRLANLAAGETVLIHGAGGGVGTAAVQLARLRGATIIGAASAAKHEALRALGAAHVIDYRKEDVAAAVRRLTNGRGVDVVLDSIGGGSFAVSYKLLAPLGRLVLYGVSSIAPGSRRNWWHVVGSLLRMPRFRPLSLINRNRGVFGLNLAHLWDEKAELRKAMTWLLQEVEAGTVRPVIAATFPLERAADAHRSIQSRANVGKVVLTM